MIEILVIMIKNLIIVTMNLVNMTKNLVIMIKNLVIMIKNLIKIPPSKGLVMNALYFFPILTVILYLLCLH